MRLSRALCALLTVTGATACHDGERLAPLGTYSGALTWDPETTLVPADQPVGGDFGYSVAIDGTTAVVGAQGDDVVGSNSGSAYVFVLTAGWAQQAKLVPADAASGDEFGYSVAVDGDTTFVGAYQNDDGGTNSGATYVFTRNGQGAWSQAQKLLASDATTYDNFGIAVAIDGNTAAIGAHQDDFNGGASGSVYVFTRSAQGVWSQHQKLVAADGAMTDLFGRALALEGNTLVVGAQRDDDMGSNSGSAYVFSRDPQGAWSQSQKLTAFDGGTEDNFGFTVSLSGNSLVVGAHQNDAGASDAGAAYAFVRSGQGPWSFEQKLTASDGAAGDLFGRELALDGSVLVVGAWGDDDQGADSGSGYAFERNAQGMWSQAQKILRVGGVAGDFFGRAVAIDGNNAILTAHGALSGNGLAVALSSTFAFGDACTTTSECASGHCVDGVCCNTTCTGACESCNQPGLEGACSAAPAGQPGNPTCGLYVCDGISGVCPASCSSSAQCAPGNHCDAGQCVPLAVLGAACTSDAACISAVCADGFCCDAQCGESCARCDVAGFEGTCTPLSAGEAGNPACAPYLCNGAATCPASCVGDVDCVEGYHCAAGLCAADIGIGVACSSEAGCASGHCVDGVCCASACEGPCERCDEPVSPGACSPVDDGTPCPDGLCEAGLCVEPPGTGGGGGASAGTGGASSGGSSATAGGASPGGSGGSPSSPPSAEPPSADGGCQLGRASPRPEGLAWAFLALAIALRRRPRP